MRIIKTRARIKRAFMYTLIAVLTCSYPLSTSIRQAGAVSDSAATDTTTTQPNYTYDSATKHWNTDSWRYNSTSGKYEPITPPAPPVDAPTINSQKAADPSLASDTSSAATNSSSTTNNTVDNTAVSSATSGAATVANNTTAGSATSGNAQATGTIINSINSSTGGVVSFTANVTGDVTGDIQLYPMIVKAMSESGAIGSVASGTTSTNSQITNNVNLNATSGNATVASNTAAGSATTGNANTVVNIMNIINSLVAANKSFVGVINIYGNLNGDILIAPDFIPQLIANNASSSVSTLDMLNNSQINNNISLGAASGSATVAGNTSAGSATTGSAATNLVLLNLSGHQVIASNSLLVFVNVLGKWVGVIVDAPAGSTAAAIGNNVIQNNITSLPVGSSQTNSLITNNIALNSQTGNASVVNNTSAGNATSGNATSSANILNMTQSIFGLSGWFGTLFINVFGSWLGSFGINTANGNVVPPPESSNVGQSASQPPAIIRFIDKSAVLRLPALSSTPTADTPTASPDNSLSSPPDVLGAKTVASQSVSGGGYGLLAALLSGIGIIVIALAASLRRLWWPVIFRRTS